MARAPNRVRQRFELREAKQLAEFLGDGSFDEMTVSCERELLVLDGVVLDMSTAFPHPETPRWWFCSPMFKPEAVPKAWSALHDKLRELPARTRFFTLEGEHRAELTLVQTTSGNWSIVLAFGPIVPAMVSEGLE